MSLKRLMKDFKECLVPEYQGFFRDVKPFERNVLQPDGSVEPEQDWFRWNGFLLGPHDSPYSGFRYAIELRFTDNYPMRPPKVLFKTKIFHPNVAENGSICLNTLVMPPNGAWNGSLGVAQVLVSLVNLLSEGNPDDPLNAEAGRLAKENVKEFVQTVERYNHRYASRC